MASLELIQRDPKELKNYPLNISMYREHIDDEFVASIKAKGIQSPLTICKSSNPLLNDFIVMGRRRRIAALTCKLKTVPCIVWECDDPLEFEERLILDNIRNETTVEERARMYEELLRIESEKAARRQKSTQKNGATPVTEKVPSPENIGEKGESSVKAAKQVGMSNKTADKAVGVVHAADKLEAEGKPEAAAEVRETLNNGTVAAAVRKVAEVTAPASKPPTEDQQHSKDIDKQSVKLVASIAAAVTSAEEMMKAIDNKCRGSEPMRNRKKKFETLLHKMRDLLEPVEHHAGIVAKAWSDTKGQVDQ